jgi:alcohol dehydrogenase (cytochrome c)
MTWVPSTYDPDLNLLYFGTGNPQPVIAGQGREGSNLYTECIIALNPDTGKLQWYFQPSPHDTHDWDAVQTPVLFDGEVNDQPRKLLAQASRNGWFFVLDRATGQHILSSEFVRINWTLAKYAKGAFESGQAAQEGWRAGDSQPGRRDPADLRLGFNPKRRHPREHYLSR